MASAVRRCPRSSSCLRRGHLQESRHPTRWSSPSCLSRSRPESPSDFRHCYHWGRPRRRPSRARRSVRNAFLFLFGRFYVPECEVEGYVYVAFSPPAMRKGRDIPMNCIMNPDNLGLIARVRLLGRLMSHATGSAPQASRLPLHKIAL